LLLENEVAIWKPLYLVLRICQLFTGYENIASSSCKFQKVLQQQTVFQLVKILSKIYV
jgi:hypothetical protein